MAEKFISDDEGLYIYKDPNATKDYKVDWTAWLAGEDILIVNWIIPAGITEVTRANDAKTATIVLSGGTPHKNYLITCQITTASARQNDKSFRVVINEQ